MNILHFFLHFFSLEMLIIQNVDITVPMKLGMPSVRWIFDHCPNLSILGNLRNWSLIDYYDSESQHFYRAESELSQYKAKAVASNWDLDLEVENLDYLYT
jgi:hypothetical protein